MSRTCPACHGTGTVPGGMRPVDLKMSRGVLGTRSGLGRPLQQATFAKLLGVTERTLRNYLNGHRAIPFLVAQEARRLHHQKM